MIVAEQFYADNFQKGARFSISRKKMEMVVNQVSGKNLDDIIKMLLNSPAKAQFLALASMYCIAVENCQQPRDLDPAGDIIYRLGENIANYGDRAYSLSEAQIKTSLQRVIGKI